MGLFKRSVRVSESVTPITEVTSVSTSDILLVRGKILIAPADYDEASIEAVVIRCGCENSDSHFGVVCPKGIEEDLGTISYSSTDPIKQAAWDAIGAK